MRASTILRSCVLLLAVCAPLGADDDVVLRAMRDELTRSMQKLQLNALAKPYFIAYRVDEIKNADSSATFGSLLNSSRTRTRLLFVELRVGDYALDNSNFIALSFGASGVVHQAAGFAELPLEDDYVEIRRQIWLATDSAYKKALEDFARKKAVLESEKRAEDIPDFSRVEPATIADLVPEATLELPQAESLVRDLSAAFKQMPAVFTSSVHLSAVNTFTRYVNSEGSSYTRSDPGVMMTAVARTQAEDGMPLEDVVACFGRAAQDLPKKEALLEHLRELGDRLGRVRSAPLLDNYNGPVLIEGQAAAEVFSQVFAPRLLALRRPLSDNPQLGMLMAQREETFAGRIGGRVLPEFLSVIDDPLLEEFDHVRLVGGYKVDDEGVPARRTLVVEKGVLKTLLASRDPVPGVLHSTGNRGGPAPLPSNLLLRAESGPKADEMKAELIKLVKQRGKDYGILITRLGNPYLAPSPSQMMAMFMPPGAQAARGMTVTAAYKVFPDGREELLRNLELADMTAAAFKDIVLASRDQTAYSSPFNSPAQSLSFLTGGGATEGGVHILSYVVPSLLFDDLTLRREAGEVPNLPVAKHPFFDR